MEAPGHALTFSGAPNLLRTFDVVTDPDFATTHQVIADFSQRHPLDESDFCVIGLESERVDRFVYVVWFQGNKLILWEGGDDLQQSRRFLDMRSDVVSTQEELHGSSYLTTRAWLDDLVAACKRHGTTLHLGTRPRLANASSR